MHSRTLKRFAWLVRPGLALAVLGIFVMARATADETHAKPTPQKVIAQPFLDGMVGSWSTESTATHDGKEYKGTGTSTFSRAIGGTAILQEYESKMPGPDGKQMSFFGHGVTKLSDDGKTASMWWFCNMSPDGMKVTGSVTDKSIDLAGESPEGGHVTVSFQKSADGLTFKMTHGADEMTDTYKKK